MTSVEEALTVAEAAGEAVDLTKLGPAEQLSDELAALAQGPLAPLAASALALVLRRGPGAWDSAALRFAEELGGQRSVLALGDSIDVLLGDKPIAAVTAARLYTALLRDVEPLIHEHPLVAVTRIEGALRVALGGGATPYLVLERLTAAIDPEPPPDYVSALPRLIGAALDVWTADSLATPLRDTLQRLRTQDPAEADATFEIACESLRTALRLTDPEDAAAALAATAGVFDQASQLEEGRDDALVYSGICRAVTAFASGEREALERAATQVDEVMARREAWHLNAHLPTWRQPVLGAEQEWLGLVLDLRAASARLAESSWLDTAAAIGQIGRVYTAERASAPAPGLTAVVRPAVENAVTANAVLLDQLRRTVERLHSSGEPRLPAGAELLLAALRRRRQTRSPAEADADEEDDPAVETRIRELAPSLLRLGHGICRSLAELNDADLAEFGELVAVMDSVEVNADPILRDMRQEIRAQLGSNPRFRGEAQAVVLLIVDRTLAFLRDRYDRGGPLLPGGVNIIALIPEGGRMPVEADLQYEFYIWLSVSRPLAGRVNIERPHVATGRVDVTVRVGEISFVTEVKRELEDSSPQALQQYVPQTAQYSGSSEPFSQLLVLDLTDHRNGVRPLRDLAWVVEHRADTSASPQHVVVAVVAGNRPTPRQLTDRGGRQPRR
jgi:hypothetical protein